MIKLTPPKTRILLVDDHKIMREGLRALLKEEASIEVIGEADDGLKAIKFAKRHLPDIVIMDVAMPNMNGIEATRQIVMEIPEVKVIALSMFIDKHFIAKMVGAGARGYLLKDCAADELVRAVRAVADNKFYISTQLGNSSMKEIMSSSDMSSFLSVSSLTAKEREVLQLIAEGRTTKYIADYLRVSAKTIDKHREHIMRKLDIHSIAELTKFAIREGLTSANT